MATPAETTAAAAPPVASALGRLLYSVATQTDVRLSL
jgi:hypothetical protein